MGASSVEDRFETRDEEHANWNLTDIDRMLLRQTDEEYEPHSWEELKWIVGKQAFELCTPMLIFW